MHAYCLATIMYIHVCTCTYMYYWFQLCIYATVNLVYKLDCDSNDLELQSSKQTIFLIAKLAIHDQENPTPKSNPVLSANNLIHTTVHIHCTLYYSLSPYCTIEGSLSVMTCNHTLRRCMETWWMGSLALYSLALLR